MIVRISGQGQYELDDAGTRKLDELDSRVTDALQNGREEEFHQALAETIKFVCDNGKVVPATTVVPSDVIVPPDDITLEEAKGFFTDEGLMEPLPA